MANFSTTLGYPGASRNFSHSIDYNNILCISGYSRTYEEYSIPREQEVDAIINSTSLALKIKWVSHELILFPEEAYELPEDDELSGGTLLTIYPCVLMNLITRET